MDPPLIVEGKNFEGDLGIQIAISVFMVIAIFDFTIQTVMVLWVYGTIFRSTKSLTDGIFAVFSIILFLAIRSTLVPVMIIPIPYSWAPTIPEDIANGCFYANIACFSVFFSFTFLSCVYYMIRVGITGKKMNGSIIDEKTGLQPMVVILMPIYNEEPDALFRAVESAIRCDYPSDRKHVFLAFDDAEESALYFALLKKLRVLSTEVSEEIKRKIKEGENRNQSQEIQEKGNKISIFPPRLEWVIEGVRVTICRFPHGGKSPTQGQSFKIINEIYGQKDETAANTLVMFIDSDIILHENALHNFVVAAVKNPKIKGVTGLVTCRTSRKFNVYQYLQDSEYVDGQMFVRTAEAIMGAVSCLPGALTLIRLNALQKVAPKYFIEFDKKRSADFHRYHLGEDRYMTYLLTELSDGPYQVTFVSSAQCKTDAPDTFKKLLKQRRRWFLGGLTNDICMMASPLMWRKLPFMVLFKTYFYSLRGLDWLFGIMIVSWIAKESPGIVMYVLFGLMGLRYLLLCLNALLMTRKKIFLSNLLLFFLNPFFYMAVTLYSIWTWNVRSWGGPRTDAPDDDAELSQIKVLEQVMKQREGPVGRTRKSLQELKSVSRIIEKRAAADGKISHEIRVSDVDDDAPFKKFVPFPYEMEFLGGGDNNSNFLKPLPPGSPILSGRRKSNELDLIGLHPPPLLGSELGAELSQIDSSSMPNLSTLSPINQSYVFGKLSTATLERASSFHLDTDYLARYEDLATLDNSSQRNSSFNLRLSGRSSPATSREPSIYDFNVSDGSSIH